MDQRPCGAPSLWPRLLSSDPILLSTWENEKTNKRKRGQRNRPRGPARTLTFWGIWSNIIMFDYAVCQMAPHSSTCPVNQRKPDKLRESQAGGYTARSGLLELEAVEKKKSFLQDAGRVAWRSFFFFGDKKLFEQRKGIIRNDLKWNDRNYPYGPEEPSLWASVPLAHHPCGPWATGTVPMAPIIRNNPKVKRPGRFLWPRGQRNRPHGPEESV